MFLAMMGLTARIYNAADEFVDGDDQSSTSEAGDESEESDDYRQSGTVHGHCEGDRCSNVDIISQWIRFNLHDSLRCIEVLKRLLETIKVLLGEPIILRLLPYLTHRSYDDMTNVNYSNVRNKSKSSDEGSEDRNVMLNDWGINTWI